MSRNDGHHSRRRFLAGVGAGTAATALAGCIGGLTGGGGPVTVGATIPNSGDLAVFGTRNERGMNLALDDINEAGILGDREIELAIEDTQTSPDTGVSAAQKLVNQDGVQSIIGAVSSGVTMAIAQSVTIPNEVVQVATASTSREVAGLDDDQYVLRTAVSSALQGQALATMTRELGIDTISFVHVNNSYGIGYAEAMGEAFESQGGTVASTVSYESGKSSYRPVLNSAMEGDPGAIVFVGYPESFTTMSKQAYEMGIKEEVQYVASDGIVADAVEENVPAEAINGMVGLNPTPPLESDHYQRFVSGFEESYDKQPTIWAAYAYDAMMLTAIAIEAAGEVASTPIRDSIYDISRPDGTEVTSFADAKSALSNGDAVNYQGASGSVDLNEAGDVPGTYREFEVVDGEFELGEFVEAPA